MNKLKTTYRFLAAVTAIAVLAGIALPSGLQAHDLFCAIDMDHQSTEVTTGMQGEHCETHASNDHHPEADNDSSSTCDLGFSCDCGLVEVPAKSEAVPVITKAAITLTAKTVDYSDNSQSSGTFLGISNPDLHSSLPPIFLKNSTFLN